MPNSDELDVPLVHHEDSENHLAPLVGDGRENGCTELPRVNFWRWITFSWVFNLLQIAQSSERLDADDLPHLAADAMPDACGDILWESWKRHEEDSLGVYKKPKLVWAMFRPFLVPYLKLGVLKFVNDALSFVGPVLLNALLVYLDDGKNTVSQTLPFLNVSFFSLPPQNTLYGVGLTALLGASLLLKVRETV